MKFVMPLFEFHFNGIPYTFSDDFHSINRFNMNDYNNLSFFFSEHDRFNMESTNWALILSNDVINESNYKIYLGNSDLFLLCFKVF